MTALGRILAGIVGAALLAASGAAGAARRRD